MPDNTQRVSLGDKKFKYAWMFPPPDSFDKYLTLTSASLLRFILYVIVWQTLKLPYISKVILGGDNL